MTEQMWINLNIRELYDMLALSNCFVEIGCEFSGNFDLNSDINSLIKYLKEKLTRNYLEQFNKA